MKRAVGFLLVAVCIGWSSVVEGSPHVSEVLVKGVNTVKNLVLGPRPAPWHNEAPWRMEFDPDEGLRRSPEYQRRYGRRGERLVHLLGSGGYRPRDYQ